jgi:hypothetical protein
MLQWLGGPRPVVGTPEEGEMEEDHNWNDGQGYEMQTMLTDFKMVRSQQLELLPQFDERLLFALFQVPAQRTLASSVPGTRPRCVAGLDLLGHCRRWRKWS